ncbi:putative oxysterol-binding protein 8 [Monocercomonoides exilis]|uniref:putative oxysterol-binding protein 8 n=1 Tax=Monocercomonoides exilis TaxID=2049356 RepID=UPI00355A7187|nr:putative oxysterol-binding protein 8 [Monocercomonoides exilis]|eukprot:MONOS_16772.1-p1 / transcript=MONOS_16772.1 / gene=MONOS_16772 / organism=Monocercomonoides_exilis_PA203 / gene_product=oxysterol-binding protein 8 / transcript_product=oxysterol-binding protein 8 / location=Mono_scaffold00010:225773-227813(+) / protein_length=633 / sequence_SO=supercontig / SO=protein_coding / is_pseudo=false
MSESQDSQRVSIEDESSNDTKDMQAVFDEEEVLDDKPRSIMMDIFKQITSGKDLTRISMPAFISEPRSFIETTANLFSHMAFFREAIAMDDPVDRIAHLTRFYISGFHIRPRGVKKPYNPILGEVFRCFWDHPDGSRTWYLAEQVQHHPPVCAMYFENLDAGFSIEGEIKIKSNFTGNSAGTFMLGTIYVNLLRRRETYTITYPVWYARGVVVGKMRMETVGKTRIACEQTGLEALINFKAKPTFGGKYNQVVAEIFEMQGGGIPMPAMRESENASPSSSPSPSPSSSPSFASSPHGTPSPSSTPSGMPTPNPQRVVDKKKASKRKPLVTIQGDWTSRLWATDHRVPPHLSRPATLTVDATAQLASGGAAASSQSSSATPSSSSVASPSHLNEELPEDLSKENSMLFFDVQTSPFTSKRALAVANQDWYESRKVWEKLTASMREKDYEKARDAKVEVEEEGRKRAKDRLAKKVGWRQRHFHWDPTPRTMEEIKESPEGRWRFNWSVDCAISTAEDIDPANRRITCFNVPDMSELMSTAPPLTQECIKKDEDTKATDFLTLADAEEAMIKKGLGPLKPRWPMGPPPVELKRSSEAHHSSSSNDSEQKDTPNESKAVCSLPCSEPGQPSATEKKE